MRHISYMLMKGRPAFLGLIPAATGAEPLDRLWAMAIWCKRTFVAIALLTLLLFQSAQSEETNIDVAIAAVKQATIGKTVPVAEIATNFLRLLETFKKPEEQGKVYRAVASSYAFKGSRYPEMVKDYTEKALALPLSAPNACQMCVYLSDSYSITMRTSPDDQITALRLQNLKALIRGLKILEDNLKGEERKDLPIIPRITWIFDTNDVIYKERIEPEYKKLLKEREVQWKLREEIIEQNKLLDFKDRFKRKIIGLYSGFPDTADEVIVEGRKILRDEVLLQELVRSIREKQKAKPGKQIIAP